jgi:hypothetical protein
MMDEPTDYAIPLQLPQWLNQHFLRDRWNGAAELGESPYRPVQAHSCVMGDRAHSLQALTTI